MTLMLGKTEGRRRGRQRMRGWMASSTQWTWLWASSRSWWRTGKPGVLQSMGSPRPRVGHDWADWIAHFKYMPISISASPQQTLIYLLSLDIYLFCTSFFLLFNNIPCLHISHFVYQLTNWWTFGLCSLFGHYEQCRYKYLQTCFHLLGMYQGVQLLGHMVTLCLSFWELLGCSNVGVPSISPPAT